MFLFLFVYGVMACDACMVCTDWQMGLFLLFSVQFARYCCLSLSELTFQCNAGHSQITMDNILSQGRQ